MFGFAAIRIPYGVDSVAGRILPCHEAGAGGGAVRGSGVGIGESHAFFREAIDVWGLVIDRTLAGKIGVAEVVGVDQNDVWASG